MKKAFTITELLVAVALMAVVITISGVIFNYSIDAQRKAMATSEIMRNFRVITDQLNADFAGLQKDVPILCKPEDVNDTYADSIVFFSAGSFQTTNTYSTEPIRGNIARIYYGQAAEHADSNTPKPLDEDKKNRQRKVLARKQIILSPDANSSTNEYESYSYFEQLKDYDTRPVTTKNEWLNRPQIDPNDKDEIVMFMARGVDNFKIEIDEGDNGNNGIDPNGSIAWWSPANSEDHDYSLVKFSFTILPFQN